ncbi:hypothetical protein BCV72DRAFT_331345, partial [Rhizopus microsporus var. microsporus]
MPPGASTTMLSALHLRSLLLLPNKLLTSSRVYPRYAGPWRFYWSIICSILSKVDQLQHG